MKIILDTNFLIYCAKEKLDYNEEIQNLINERYELVVPEQVVEELKRLAKKTKKWSDKEASNLALQLLGKNKIKIIDVNGKKVDDVIINLAKENPKNIVCTLDREMRKELPRVILLNRNKKLILTR
ncbi:MAG: PIN domain-containing protein [Nanoarchaeota archaeon]